MATGDVEMFKAGEIDVFFFGRKERTYMSKMNESVPKRVDIGGQAVMEGVMMKAPRAIAVSVRRPDHTIVTKLKPYTPLSEKH